MLGSVLFGSLHCWLLKVILRQNHSIGEKPKHPSLSLSQQMFTSLYVMAYIFFRIGRVGGAMSSCSKFRPSLLLKFRALDGVAGWPWERFAQTLNSTSQLNKPCELHVSECVGFLQKHSRGSCHVADFRPEPGFGNRCVHAADSVESASHFLSHVLLH